MAIGHIEIRRAKEYDFQNCMLLLRKCFQDSVRYKMPLRYWGKWWTLVINSPAVETYVLCADKNVAGFALMVIDEHKYNMVNKKSLPPLYKSLLFSSFASPWNIISITKRCVRNLRGLSNAVMPEMKSGKGTNDIFLISERIWLDIMAILPEYQGRGLSKIFLTYIEKRTCEIGRKCVGLCIDWNNQLTIRLFEGCGYKAKSRNKKSIIFKKYLLEI